MKIPASVLLLLLAMPPALVWPADNDPRSLQITVNDIAGKPAAGVPLWAESVNTKAKAQQAVSNSEGRAAFRNLAPGIYKISAYDNRTPSAAAALARVNSNQSATVTLGLAKMVKSSNPGKKQKHY